MKKILILFIVIFSFAGLSAQNSVNRHPRRVFNAEEAAARLTNELHDVVGLDSLQYQVVYLLNYSDMVAMQDSMKLHREKFEEMRKQGKVFERKAHMEIMQQRKNARDEQMKGLLSAEQYEKYLKYEEEREKRRKEGMRNMRKRGIRKEK